MWAPHTFGVRHSKQLVPISKTFCLTVPYHSNVGRCCKMRPASWERGITSNGCSITRGIPRRAWHAARNKSRVNGICNISAMKGATNEFHVVHTIKYISRLMTACTGS